MTSASEAEQTANLNLSQTLGCSRLETPSVEKALHNLPLNLKYSPSIIKGDPDPYPDKIVKLVSIYLTSGGSEDFSAIVFSALFP